MSLPIEPNEQTQRINQPPPAATQDHHRPPDDSEVVYFDGRPMLRADQAKLLLWIVLGLAFVSLPVLAYAMPWEWWRWWMTLSAILLAILVVTIPWLKLRATRYRISNYRIDFERGILKKQIDTLELWHVDDIRFEQGIIDRMFNVGSITIMSNDKSTPKLELQGVPHPREIFDSLKQRIIAVKRQRGVLKMDMG